MTMTDVCLTAEGLELGYRTRHSGAFTAAVSDLNLQVMEHEFAVVVGPSGSGKSTFLEAVAGLVPVSGGSLRLNGTDIKGSGPERSLVFQHASLFPWRTVLGNVMYGLEVQRRLTPETKRRARELLEIVGLGDAVDKYPHELSGGMKQRANLARALATDPSLLLLDEPFGALDAQTREMLQEELLRIWQADTADGRRTALFITHDVAEAVLLADKVFVFSPAPASIATVVAIDVPRPREAAWRRSTQFTAYCDEILAALHQEPTSSTTSAREHADRDAS